MKRTISCVFFFALLVLQSCIGGVYFEKIVNGYYLTAMDYVDEGMNLSYVLESGDFIGVVNSTVLCRRLSYK